MCFELLSISRVQEMGGSSHLGDKAFFVYVTILRREERDVDLLPYLQLQPLPHQ